jgi:aspartate/methionine/tyrosine aminotransferase
MTQYLHSSQRMAAVQTPVIAEIGELIRQHPGTISLGQGVAYYGPPPSVQAHIQNFCSDLQNHRYGPVQGIAPLIDRIHTKLLKQNGIIIAEDRRIVVTAGANMGFLNALLAIADPGDEVILPLPYYFNHEMAVRMLNCVPVAVPTDSHYQLDLKNIEEGLTPRTRAIVTISPNNPTGAVYPEASLRAVNALCAAHGLYHITDETYEDFVYGPTPHFSTASISGSERHTISLFSLSKAYGFASWRIGYMVLPEHLYGAVLKVQDTNLICPTLIAQHAAVGALETGASYCRGKLEPLRTVRDRLLESLAPLGTGCEIPSADGAFYVLIRLHLDADPMQIAERLIREHKVAVVPGSAFGMNDGCYLRIAYGALEVATATEGLRRLAHGLRALLN